MNRTKTIGLAAVVAAVGLAAVAVNYWRAPDSGASLAPAVPAGSVAAGPSGERTPPAAPTAPGAPLATPAPAPAAGAPPDSGKFGEKEFIELSATILIRVAQVQDRPDAEALIPAIMEKSLSEAGVKEEDFEALGKQIHADPERSNRVADAILKRVEDRATPDMRMRVADLAEAMARSRQGRTAGE